MKMNKWFMLGMVGLAFTACSNEEDVTGGNPTFSGNGAVSIRIVNPAITRTVATPDQATGNKVTLADDDLTINLYEKADVNEANPKTITINTSQLTSDQTVTFWNVTEPGKVTVSINGGQKNYTAVSIVGMQQAPTEIPAYGETTNFVPKEDDPISGSPNLSNDNDIDNTGHEQGAEDGDENKKYQFYTATVEMKIPVARLEVSGIVHVDGEGTTCEYKTLTIKGVYLDNVYDMGGTYAEANGSNILTTGFGAPAGGTNVKDYCWGTGLGLGTEVPAALKDEITDNTNFLAEDVEWPGDDKAYAYNFYAGTEKPIFKIYFDTAEESEASPEPHRAPRFAMIKEYTGLSTANFEPGKIYRITSAQLKDGNILGDESGNTQYGVIVTVEEATWDVLEIGANWAE